MLLISLLVGLESEGPNVLVIDMIEEGLDEATGGSPDRISTAAFEQWRTPDLFFRPAHPRFSTSPLLVPMRGLFSVPANHSPPSYVIPRPGAPGYEVGCRLSCVTGRTGADRGRRRLPT